MSRVEVTNGAVIVPSEDRNGRVLIPLAVFAPAIVFERIIPTTQEPQPVPATRARVCSQRDRIDHGDNGNVDILSQMMSDTIPTVNPKRAHWAWRRILLSKHKVIDDQRSIRRAEQFAQSDGSDRRVASVKFRWTLLESIVLNCGALWESAAKLCYALTLAHQLNFRQSEFLSLRQIFVGFVRQIGLSKRTIDHLECHRFIPP